MNRSFRDYGVLNDWPRYVRARPPNLTGDRYHIICREDGPADRGVLFNSHMYSDTFESEDLYYRQVYHLMRARLQ